MNFKKMYVDTLDQIEQDKLIGKVEEVIVAGSSYSYNIYFSGWFKYLLKIHVWCSVTKTHWNYTVNLKSKKYHTNRKLPLLDGICNWLIGVKNV